MCDPDTILDDFMFVGPPKSNATERDLSVFLNLKLHQNVAFPSNMRTLLIPIAKLPHMALKLTQTPCRRGFQQKNLIKLVSSYWNIATNATSHFGNYNSLLAFSIWHARSFDRVGLFNNVDLIDLSKKSHYKHHFISLSKCARADIEAWLLFRDHFNGISLFLHDQFTVSDSIRM